MILMDSIMDNPWIKKSVDFQNKTQVDLTKVTISTQEDSDSVPRACSNQIP